MSAGRDCTVADGDNFVHGADAGSIERLRAKKALERGSFAAGVVLGSTDEDGA